MTIPFYSHLINKQKKNELAFNPAQPRDPKGSPTGGHWTSGNASSQKSSGSLFYKLAAKRKAVVNEDDYPPSFKLTDDIVLYHATSNAQRVERTGLSPRLPQEIVGGDIEIGEYRSVVGVYLTDRTTANSYLMGRLGGQGNIVSVYLPAGTVLYADPLDPDSVFVKMSIPGRAIKIIV